MSAQFAQSAKKMDLSRVRARLLLCAVLPALAELVDCVPQAAALLPQQGLRIALRGRGGVRQALHLNREGGSRSGADLPADITLHFLSDAQAEAQLLGRLSLPPLPLRGLTRIASLRAFSRLSDLLQVYLRPPADLSQQTDAFVRAHVELSLAVALRAVCELSRIDPAIAGIIRKAPEGTVCFSVGATAGHEAQTLADGDNVFQKSLQPLWLRFSGGSAQCGVSAFAGDAGADAGTGDAGGAGDGEGGVGSDGVSAASLSGQGSVSADACVHFADLALAAGVLRNCVDTQAQIGTGGIRVCGLLPLADAVSATLDELKKYLPVD